MNQEKSCRSILRSTRPLQMAGDSAACSSLQFGLRGGCGEGNFSAEVELLRAGWWAVLWKVYLAKLQGEGRSWKRYALPGSLLRGADNE